MTVDKTEYLQNLKTFENFHDFAIDISDKVAGYKVPTHLAKANQLFIRMTMTSLSIIHLLPENTRFPAYNGFWDFFSIASLARNLVENYHMFYYVGVEDIPQLEREFRLMLLVYHHHCEQYKLYRESDSESNIIREFETNLPKEKEDLKSHPFFNNLSKEISGKVLGGKTAMYLNNKEVSNRIHFNTDEFMLMYRLLSNHTHSTHLSFFSMTNVRGNGEENINEIAYITMTIDFCIKYLSAAIIDMFKLFPMQTKSLNQTKYKLVREKLESYESENGNAQ